LANRLWLAGATLPPHGLPCEAYHAAKADNANKTLEG